MCTDALRFSLVIGEQVDGNGGFEYVCVLGGCSFPGSGHDSS